MQVHLVAIISMKDLTKTFGNATAVDHLSLDINEGEIFGLLGPNGAGKSTTILLLATVIRPTEGTATVGGYDIRKRPGKSACAFGSSVPGAKNAMGQHTLGHRELSRQDLRTLDRGAKTQGQRGSRNVRNVGIQAQNRSCAFGWYA